MRLVPLIAAVAVLAVPVSAQPQSEDTRLKALFAASNEDELKREPLEAISRGDLRYADRLGDYLSDSGDAADKAAIERDLAGLAAIDRTKLTPTDQLAYDVFAADKRGALAGYAPAVQDVARLLPLNHFGGLQTFYPTFASGQGSAPFKTVADYDNNLKRNAQYAVTLDRAIARFREGLARGVVQPKLVVSNMIAQFDNLIAEGVEGSTFYAPVKSFPATISAADRTRLTAAYAAQVRDVVLGRLAFSRDLRLQLL